MAGKMRASSPANGFRLLEIEFRVRFFRWGPFAVGKMAPAAIISLNLPFSSFHPQVFFDMDSELYQRAKEIRQRITQLRDSL